MISGPFHHSIALPYVRMEERYPIWRVAADKINKKPRTTDKSWYYSEVLATHLKILACCETFGIA